MYYGHKGNATDNAFTTYNGQPTREFYAFETKQARQDAQDKIWRESGQSENLIFCPRKMVVRWLGKGFVTLEDGRCMSDEGYEAYCQELEYHTQSATV